MTCPFYGCAGGTSPAKIFSSTRQGRLSTMTDQPPAYENSYHNAVTGVAHEANPLDEKLTADVNYVLTRAAELARVLIGAHQSAIALIAHKDWTFVRKYFSLSSKYAQWADYS